MSVGGWLGGCVCVCVCVCVSILTNKIRGKGNQFHTTETFLVYICFIYAQLTSLFYVDIEANVAERM